MCHNSPFILHLTSPYLPFSVHGFPYLILIPYCHLIIISTGFASSLPKQLCTAFCAYKPKRIYILLMQTQSNPSCSCELVDGSLIRTGLLVENVNSLMGMSPVWWRVSWLWWREPKGPGTARVHRRQAEARTE